MADKLFKLEIDSPTTTNKTKSLLMTLDKNQGPSFRIERCWVSFPGSDAEATGDKKIIQFSLENQNEGTDVLEIDDPNEIYTWAKSYDVLGTNGNRTEYDDTLKCIELKDIAGTFLETNKKNYITSLFTGQAAVAATDVTKIKILGQYVSTDKQDWNDNKF